MKRAEYSYYPGLDNLHAVVINKERLYAHADGLGNVIALTDEAQAVRRTYGYDDWGNSGGTSGTLALPDADRARWKGALWMGPDLDLYYMRNRWYEPAAGRFLSEDPKGLAGGSNPLVFAVNNPITNRDPDGRVCEVVELTFTVTNKDGTTEEVKVEGLQCKDIGPGDFTTIKNYLGGESGIQAFNFFADLGLTAFRLGSSCKGGFTIGQCERIAESLSSLTLHRLERCRSLGVAATKRFQKGRFELKSMKGNDGYAQKFLPWGKIFLDPRVFTDPRSSYLTEIVAHEARHCQAPFAGGGFLGMSHDDGDSVYLRGQLCAQ